jgi:tight adherence protein C
MPTDLITTLGAVFLAVALLAGIVASLVLSRGSQGARRRLEELSNPTRPVAMSSGLVIQPEEQALTDVPDPEWNSLLELLPTSRGSTKRLKRELAMAGFDGAQAAAIFSLTELVLPVIFGGYAIVNFEGMNRIFMALFGALVGYLAPGFLLGFRLKKRKRQIENGLADTLDLLVLCLEAGSSLDQAIIKAGEELGVAYPALGDQLRILIAEIRTGKTRLDAFRGLADRTQVDDVRALVAMMIQTDRFGTSVAQALRTHAEVCRTKRRQRAEERAQKVGVKLVFPLVFCLFPALYVVMLGPAYLQFMKVFMGM